MRKSLDADVSEHWVKPVKISLLEQAIEAAFNLDRIKASPKATQGEHCLQCTGLADPTMDPHCRGGRRADLHGAPIRNYLQNNMESSGTKAQAQRTQTAIWRPRQSAIQEPRGSAWGNVVADVTRYCLEALVWIAVDLADLPPQT